MTRRPSLVSTVPLVVVTALLLALVPVGAWSAPAGGTVDVIVVLHDAHAPGGHAANQAAAARVAAEHGLSARYTYGTALFGFAASVPESRLARLRADSRVDYIDLDGPVAIAAPPWCETDPDDPRCGGDDDGGGGTTTETIPWGVERIGADTNLNEGSGIHIYVIDTGIDADHGDLQANLATDTNNDHHAVEQCKGGGCLYPWDDDHDHGTHVAGTVGAIKGNSLDVEGVASQVTLHAVKVLAKSGMGSRSGVTAGIDWVTSHVSKNEYGGRAVANMSLGGSGSKSGTCSSTGFLGSDSYHEAICNATLVGVVFAVAAGNDGADAEKYVPAAYDDTVVTASATKCSVTDNTCKTGSDDWPSWSNWGDNTATWTSLRSAPVAIAAPGSSVLSLKRGGGTTTMSGTSMAAPHVAGAVALYLESTTSSSTGYSVFTDARTALIGSAEETGSWKDTSGNSHVEEFLKVD